MELERIAKGIWKGRIGTPEPHTPVSRRQFPIQEEALELLMKALRILQNYPDRQMEAATRSIHSSAPRLRPAVGWIRKN